MSAELLAKDWCDRCMDYRIWKANRCTTCGITIVESRTLAERRRQEARDDRLSMVGRRYIVTGEDCCISATFTARCIAVAGGDSDDPITWDNGVATSGHGWVYEEVI